MKTLVLGNVNEHLKTALEAENVEFESYDTNELLLLVSESVNGYDRIYNGSLNLEQPVRLKAKDFDFIIPRLSGGLEYRTVIFEHLTKNLGIYAPQTTDGIKTASNKILTTLKLSQEGIRVPKTVWGKAPVHVDFIVNKMLDGLPVICKTVYGSQGVGVCILETKQTTNTVLESFYKNEINVKLQRFVNGSFKDIRAIVVGEKVVVAMERTANSKDFRANLSKSGSARKIELSEEDQKMCVDAAQALGLEFAGVDLMKDEDGISYVIEVNGNPGTKIINITGHNYFVNLVKHCKGKVKPKTNSSSENKAVQIPQGLYCLKGIGNVTVVNNGGVYKGTNYISSNGWVGMTSQFNHEDFLPR
jgi:ribosomal protein S6--L-glutamate ligase